MRRRVEGKTENEIEGRKNRGQGGRKEEMLMNKRKEGKRRKKEILEERSER